MARVTVEDCLEKVDNRFELVALAAQRAKAIASGSPITIERDNDKDSVIALREIALETIAVEDLRESLTQSFQKPSSFDDDIIDEDNEEEAKAEAGEIAAVMQEETKDINAEGPQEDGDDEALSFEEDNLDVED